MPRQPKCKRETDTVVKHELKACKHCDAVLLCPTTAIEVRCKVCKTSQMCVDLCDAASVKFPHLRRNKVKNITTNKRVKSDKKPFRIRNDHEEEDDEEQEVGSSFPSQPRKKFKDPNRPKRHVNAYMYFTFYYYRHNELNRKDTGFGQNGARAGESWRNMTEEEKEPFLQLAEEDMERYKREMREYNARRSHYS